MKFSIHFFCFFSNPTDGTLCAIRWTRNGHVLVNVTTRSTIQPCETGPLSRNNGVPGGVPKPVPPVAMVDGQDSPLITGWWFGTRNLCSTIYDIYIYGMSSVPLTNAIIFEDGYCTTNQLFFPFTWEFHQPK